MLPWHVQRIEVLSEAKRMFRILLISLLMAGTLQAADEPAAFQLAAPTGWGGETIKLPPRFAPDMSWKGVEHIRFAPGMMKPMSDSFFSYAFAFELSPQSALNAATVKEEFLKYYRGLCKAVLNGKMPEVDPANFKMELKADPAAEKTQANPVPGSSAATRYVATLDWVEPFATKKAQQLHLEIWTWSKNDHNFLFASVSPQAMDAPIWQQLRKIREDYWKK